MSRSTQETLATREYELKAQGTQLSGELERLRREGAQTKELLGAASADLVDVRSALAKREKELSDIQQVANHSIQSYALTELYVS